MRPGPTKRQDGARVITARPFRSMNLYFRQYRVGGAYVALDWRTGREVGTCCQAGDEWVATSPRFPGADPTTEAASLRPWSWRGSRGRVSGRMREHLKWTGYLRLKQAKVVCPLSPDCPEEMVADWLEDHGDNGLASELRRLLKETGR